MKELNKEKDIIRVWTNSGRRTHNVLYDNHWKEGLGYNAEVAKEKEDTGRRSQLETNPFNNMRPLCVPVKFVEPKSVLKTNIKIEDKVKVNLPEDKKEKVKQINKEFIPKKLVRESLYTTAKYSMTKSKKRNRNGKVRLDKSKFNNDSERKTCFNYENFNHLALDYLKNKKDLQSTTKSELSDNTAKIRNRSQLLCSHFGSLNHSQNACRTFYQVYARKNIIFSHMNKSINSSKKK